MERRFIRAGRVLASLDVLLPRLSNQCLNLFSLFNRALREQAPAVTERLSSDTGSSSPDRITFNPALTGAGDANAAVILKDGSAIVGTTTADPSGFGAYVDADGQQPHLCRSETDAAGNVGSAPCHLPCIAQLPSLLTPLASDTGASALDHITSNPALTGTGDANATVTLREGTTALRTTTANNSGSRALRRQRLATLQRMEQNEGDVRNFSTILKIQKDLRRPAFSSPTMKPVKSESVCNRQALSWSQ